MAISDVRVRFATDADFDAQTDVAGERRLPGLHVELALELLEVDAAAGALRSLEVVVLAEGADAPIASHSLEVRADSTSDVTLHVPAELVGARSSVAVEVYDLDGGHALEAPAGARWPTVGFYALTAEGDGERRGFHAPCGPVGEKTNAYCEPSWVY